MLLICTQPDGQKIKIRLKTFSHAPTVTIGRGKEASISVNDPKCSRIHSAIRYWDDFFIIRDMNSSNGTFVNEQKIELAKLRPGDAVRIGDTTFTIEPEKNRTDVTMAG